MRVTSVRFAMLRKTEQFENDRAEAEVELGPEDNVEDAYALARVACERGLKYAPEVEPVAVPRVSPRAVSAQARALRSAHVRLWTERVIEIMIVIALTWAANMDDYTKRASLLELQ